MKELPQHFNPRSEIPRYMFGPIDKRTLERGMPGLIILLILIGIFLILLGEMLVAGLVFFILTFVIFYRETRL